MTSPAKSANPRMARRRGERNGEWKRDAKKSKWIWTCMPRRIGRCERVRPGGVRSGVRWKYVWTGAGVRCDRGRFLRIRRSTIRCSGWHIASERSLALENILYFKMEEVHIRIVNRHRHHYMSAIKSSPRIHTRWKLPKENMGHAPHNFTSKIQRI
jgi:hypothetical protein